MGRLTGIAHFVSEKAAIEEKMDSNALRKAKKEAEEDRVRREQEKKMKEEEEAEERQKGKDVDSEKSTVVDAPANAPADEEPIRDHVKLCQVLIAQRMQTQFESRIIRRTIDSLDYENKPILNLPLCHKIYGVLQLTERETVIMSTLVKYVKDRCATLSLNAS